MALGGSTQIVNLGTMKLILLSIFSISDSLGIEIERMIHEFSLWIDVVLELLGHWDKVINVLLPGVACFPISEESELRVVLLF